MPIVPTSARFARRIRALECMRMGGAGDGEIDTATLEEARAILAPLWPAIAFELAAQGIPREASRRWLIEGMALEDALDIAR